MVLNASRIFIFAAAIFLPAIAFGQTAPAVHVPLQKTIGAAKPEVVPNWC